MAKPQVLVIGLDGATWDLIRPWAEAGHLPNLARLLEKGSGGTLTSTIPPISPAAWSSFMTGKGPGKHGVFDFTVRDFSGYGMRVAGRPAEPSLWGLLSDAGKTVNIINVPQTYPPEEVNGVMVSGLGTPSQRTFTYPSGLTSTLRREGYQINASAVLGRDGRAGYLEGVHAVAAKITATCQQLMAQSDWDLTMVVLRLTDEIPHFFWHYMDPEHPRHTEAKALYKEAVLRCYQHADQLVGELVAGAAAAGTAGDGTTVLIMSDHGFGPLHKDVYLNEWLRQEGFLVLGSEKRARARLVRLLQRLGITRTNVGHTLSRWGLERLRGGLRDSLGRFGQAFPNDDQPHVAETVDWSRTRAYSVGYIGQIYVNLQGRDPQGIVAPGADYEAVRSELTERLLEMIDPDDGKKVVDRVIRKEDVYSGRFLPGAPDLLVIMRGLKYITRQSYEFSGQSLVFGIPPTGETAAHRMEGMLLASGRGIAPGRWLDGANIVDMMPTILYLLDCEAPSDLDGRILTELLSPELLAAQPAKEGHAKDREYELGGLTPEEEEDLLEHLRNLGYIG